MVLCFNCPVLWLFFWQQALPSGHRGVTMNQVRATFFWTELLAPGYAIKVSQIGECFKLWLPEKGPFLSNWVAKRERAKSSRKPCFFCEKAADFKKLQKGTESQWCLRLYFQKSQRPAASCCVYSLIMSQYGSLLFK